MKYTRYSGTTQRIMLANEKYLIEKYGAVKNEWRGLLILLADNLDLYFQCRDKIHETGIFDVENYRKNPLIATLKDLQATIMKQIQHLGLSPYSTTKIGNLADTSDDNELLKMLTGNDDTEEDEE